MTKLIEWIRSTDAARCKIGVTDLDGVLRTKYLSRQKVEQASKGGLSFCNVIFQWDINDALYEPTPFDPTFADARATLAPTTARRLPWENDTPLLLADFYETDGPASYACPRSILRRVLDRATELGYTARFGPEFEWFLYKRPSEPAPGHPPQAATTGMFGYSGLRTGQLADYHQDLFHQLGRLRVHLEGLHTETGPGALEAALHHQPALEAADRAILFKQAVKQISHQHGMTASFMAKPRTDLPGCGGHLHQSLWRDGRNVFHNPQATDSLSKKLRQYIAGQLHWMPTLMTFYAPTVNSYKRYVPGSWAATHANWGVDNRTTALRAIPAGPGGTRLETRVPGADANPYLVIAAALASGLYGIEHELEPPPPTRGSAYDSPAGTPLPTNLGAAAAGLSTGANELSAYLSGDSLAHLETTRNWEWSRYQRAVTDWEHKRYFELA